MANPLIKVNSITIKVPPHNGSEESATVQSSPINPSSRCKIGNNQWIIDGDSGTWVCPICGQTITYSINGNSSIKVAGKSACQTGITFNIGHSGSLMSEDIVYDTNINLL